MKTLQDRVVLNDGTKMPYVGLGMYLPEPGVDASRVVRWAFEAGYRLIDTAEFYGTEDAAGKAVRESGIPREEIFVTTKLWNNHHGYDKAIRACEDSLRRMKLDYVDLYLIHWPGLNPDRMLKTWEALLELQRRGLIRTVGVSNFKIHHLERVIAAFGIVPAVDQVELHPLNTKKPLLRYAKEKGIALNAWGPIFHGHLPEVPEVNPVGAKYGKSGAQAILRWDLQNDVIVIPKSARRERIIENADIFDFELSQEDMAYLDNMNRDKTFDADPDEFTKDFE